MEWAQTLAGAGAAMAVLLLSAFLNARRGIGRVSLIPWDYLMLLSAILLIAALVHMAILWRDGRPLTGPGAAALQSSVKSIVVTTRTFW